jgi:hypothetical protein
MKIVVFKADFTLGLGFIKKHVHSDSNLSPSVTLKLWFTKETNLK